MNFNVLSSTATNTAKVCLLLLVYNYIREQKIHVALTVNWLKEDTNTASATITTSNSNSKYPDLLET